MSSDEFATLTTFRGLPVYEKDDPQVASLRHIDPHDTSYTGEVAEVDVLPKARAYAEGSEWEPRGAIRYLNAGEEDIFAVFWRKRGVRISDLPEEARQPRRDLP